MKRLKAVLEENHYQGIKTYIQSGNVVLRNLKKPDGNKISSIVKNNFGFVSGVLVLDKFDFISAIENNPYTTNEGKTLHFYFCEDTPKVDLTKIEMLRSDSEKCFIKGKVFYLYAPNGIGRSKLAGKIETCLGVSATARNLNTVNKLKSMSEWQCITRQTHSDRLKRRASSPGFKPPVICDVRQNKNTA